MDLSFSRRKARLSGAGPAVAGMVFAGLLGSGLAACGAGGGGSTTTTTGGPQLDLSHANLQLSDLPPGWKLAAPPQDSLAKHLFVCLGVLPADQPETATSATGPGQLNAISDVIGWPTVTGAQTGTAAAQGSADAKSCVGSSLHFVITAFGSPTANQVRRLGATKETASYGVSGPNGAARGTVVVTTRGRATAVILAYRTGEQPFPPKILLGLAASASQRLGEATPRSP